MESAVEEVGGFVTGTMVTIIVRTTHLGFTIVDFE
jgi:hypothetical protein